MDRGVIAPMVASMRSQFAALTATVPGSTVIERPGFTACVVPAVPERSLPNSVIYSDSDELEAAYDEVAAAYDDAGVRAWTVWVPPGESLAWLEPRGHALDSQPAGMVLDLAALGEAPPGPELEVVREGCAAALGEVNDRAYRVPSPAFAPLLANAEDAHRLYVGRVEGRDACALAIHDHGDDAMVALVATDPDFQRRGVASKLMHVALIEARERGRRVSTLQASRAGEPVYARLGYRSVGRFTMWERRAS